MSTYTNPYVEPTLAQFECEAQTLRITSGFKLTIEEARKRVVEGHGYLTWASMVRCKAKRNAA